MSSPRQHPPGPARNLYETLTNKAAEPVSYSKNVINCRGKMTEAPATRPGWIQPKFKVSRGTQVIAENIERKTQPAAKANIQLDTKCDIPLEKPVKNYGPPVPPKPAKKALTIQNKPPLPPKPVLPPKPQLCTKLQQPPVLSTTNRCTQILANSTTPEMRRRPLFVDETNRCPKSRKSSSLGRLEGRQYRGLLGEDPQLNTQLVYESGYVSCSLESLSQALLRLSDAIPPKAPPRRRRKSHPEPIYAVIDFSKKRNRRLGIQAAPEEKAEEPAINTAIDEISSVVDSGNASNTISDASSLTINTGIDSCDPSIGSQEDLQSNAFSETASQAGIDSISDIFTELSDKLNESLSCIDDMLRMEDRRDSSALGETLSSPVAVKKKIDFFNAKKDTQRPQTFVASRSKSVPRSEVPFINVEGSINEATAAQEGRGISSRSSPTASTVSLWSSDSSDSKPICSLPQNPCDSDALSIGSLGDIDTSDSTNPTSSSADSEKSSDIRNPDVTQDKPSTSNQSLERQSDESPPVIAEPASKEGNEAEALSFDREHIKPIVHCRPLSRADAKRKIQCRNASFGTGDTTLSVPKDQIRRASHELKSESNDSDTSQHFKSSTDCLSTGANESTPLDYLHGKERKAYMTAKEIASSERVFVDCLKILCDDFRNALKSASEREHIIPEGELNKILSYLPQLYNLNQDLLKDFEARVNNWKSNPKIADVIVRKGPFLKMFSAYIRDFQSQSVLLDECVQKYPKFGAIVKQFELSERCKSLSLKHYMLKPVQRLPQYRLLLEVYLKHLTEVSCDYHDTLVALKIVSEVADHANNSMKIEDNFQRLLHVQSRLSEYEIIKPGRTILKEGELHKLSRKALQLRYIILLNDSLLYTSFNGSPSATCGLKLHHELPLDDVDIRESPLAGAMQDAYEFSVFSTTRSFTLVASSEDHRKEWMDALQDAITQCKSNKLSFPTQACIRKREARLGEQAPIWIPDGRVTMCQLCTAVFSLTFRRHHCRACGRVVCRNCSSHQAPLKYLKNRPARVCDNCFYSITGESSFLDKTLSRNSRKSIIDLAIGTSSITVPSALIADAFDEELIVCKDSSSETDNSQQQSRRRNIPPKIVETFASDPESLISGYLLRRTKRGWKRSWYVLKKRMLYAYKAPEDVLALDTISVEGYQVQIPDKVTNETQRNIFQLHHQSVYFMFQADDAAAAKRWIDALVLATAPEIE